jgi:hypothetical protein
LINRLSASNPCRPDQAESGAVEWRRRRPAPTNFSTNPFSSQSKERLPLPEAVSFRLSARFTAMMNSREPAPAGGNPARRRQKIRLEQEPAPHDPGLPAFFPYPIPLRAIARLVFARKYPAPGQSSGYPLTSQAWSRGGRRTEAGRLRKTRTISLLPESPTPYPLSSEISCQPLVSARYPRTTYRTNPIDSSRRHRDQRHPPCRLTTTGFPMVVLTAIEGQTRETVLLSHGERTLVWNNARHLVAWIAAAQTGRSPPCWE